MKKIDVLVQVTDILNIVSLLESRDKHKKPTGYDFDFILFFDNPWIVEEFCNYSKTFSNVKVLLNEGGHKPENYNDHIKETDANCLYFLSDSAIIDTMFYERVTKELGI